MLVRFKSAASGDLIMFERNGREMLALLGKDPDDARGIVTVAQLPEAIAALRAAIPVDKAKQARQTAAEKEAGACRDSQVSLLQRSAPLLDMLERSLQEHKPVTWGS